jgi:hypothetical protein
MGGVHGISGNDIPELVLNEKVSCCMHLVMEVIHIELVERRRFGKSESRKRG